MVKVRQLQRFAWISVTDVRKRLDDVRSERGATMTEYGMLLIFATFAAFAILQLFGQQVLDMFTDAQVEFSDARDQQGP